MVNKLTAAFIFFFCCAVTLTINSCKKKPAIGTDLELYKMAKDTSGFIWYKFSDSLLNKSSNSAHSFPFIRTRFNSTAATRLTVYGIVRKGASFDEGSLIVKEMCDKAGKLRVYTTLYKKTGSKDADENGWIWNAVSDEGKVEISATKKGKDCISCHQQEDNIDNILMNKYFP